MRKLFFVIALGAFTFSCASNEEKSDKDGTKIELTLKSLVGTTRDFGDGFHMIEFKSDTRYYIYQKPNYSCGGEGNWSIKNGKVRLGQNNSICISTKKIKGTFELNE